ncbi:hypothetical protein LBMAG42_00920 [Deltaproteobacteria bacterium]|nr:hypothetical protein LBMAG42_00920 [Deltaproteobacteria bacterium]
MLLLPLLNTALAGSPESIFVDPGQLRILRLPGVDAASTPGGDQTPALSGSLFLTLPGAALKLTGVDELRASIPAADARVYAGLLASGEPLIASLTSGPVSLAVTTGLAGEVKCHHAEMERFNLTLSATNTVLSGQRVIAGSESDTPGACPAPVTPAP